MVCRPRNSTLSQSLNFHSINIFPTATELQRAVKMSSPGSPDLPGTERWGESVLKSSRHPTSAKLIEYSMPSCFSSDSLLTGDNSTENTESNRCVDDDYLVKQYKSPARQPSGRNLPAATESRDDITSAADLPRDYKLRGRTMVRVAPSALRKRPQYRDCPRRRPGISPKSY